ncbi:alpha-amlyase [Prolixibacteraceae bacterium JC049]|nr:alpha-amlyase [Prolixibacteraceae bacterium JC049]
MRIRKISSYLLGMLLFASCSTKQTVEAPKEAPFTWDNANVYFLLTDRFNNGNTENDVNFDRTKETAKLRGFMGGDIKGITNKIESGYFDKLGVNAIWFSPVVEQIHGSVDEGTGNTYGFHGYWAKDWTKIEPNFGTDAELAELVKKAHQHGIRIILDVVINHTGPVTEKDPVWPDEWVRTSPQCKYDNYKNTVTCTLVKNLPDVKTESTEEVQLPQQLMDKWKAEGRLKQEMEELELFFSRTGLKRTPRNYIIKWLTDYIREYGVDGFRIDTAKHTEEEVWGDLWKEAVVAFADWKQAHPQEVLDNQPFYMVGEVYNYGISGGRLFDFGDRKVDYFAQGMHSMINFEFKWDAKNSYEEIFAKYSKLLHTKLKGLSVLNYAASHDDGAPFDQMREHSFMIANKLLLCPGASQIYYGDETARPLKVEGAVGDANLRSFMNWDEINNNTVRNGDKVDDILTHWQKLGTFRKWHPSVGAGVHKMISEKPYVFSRTYKTENMADQVVVGLDMDKGKKELPMNGVFANGAQLKDYYSGKTVKVKNGKVAIDTPFSIVLLGK